MAGEVPVELRREIGRACLDPHPHPHFQLPLHAPSNEDASAWLEGNRTSGIRIVATDGSDEQEIAPPNRDTRLGRFASDRTAFVFVGMRDGELGPAVAFLRDGAWTVRALPGATRWVAWCGDELVVALPLPPHPAAPGRPLVQVVGLVIEAFEAGGTGDPEVLIRAMDKRMIWDPHAAAVAVVLPSNDKSTTSVFKTTRLNRTADLTWHYRMSTEAYHRGMLVSARRLGAMARAPTSLFIHRDDAPFGAEIAVGEMHLPEMRCTREGLGIVRRVGLETDVTIVWNAEKYASSDPLCLRVLGGEGTCEPIGLVG